MQKGIRIRERYLTALEEERWELLPGEAYTKGFLRTYAEFLGLDGNLYIEEYNARIAATEEPLVPQTLAPAYRPRRGVVRALLAIFVVTAVLAGVAAFGFGGSTQNGAKRGAVALQVQDAAAATEAPFKARALPHAQPLPVSPAGPLATSTSITAARGRCWVSVRTGGPRGAVLFRGILQKGTTLRYTLAHRLWVRMGRPRTLDIALGTRLVKGLPRLPANVLLTPAGPQAA